MNNKLIHGDSVKELNKFEDNSVDLLCTDPPYGYGFMGRDWDKVLPDIKIFEECLRVLKPGVWHSLCRHQEVMFSIVWQRC